MYVIIRIVVGAVIGFLGSWFASKKFDADTAKMKERLNKTRWNMSDEEIRETFSGKDV